MCLASTIVDTDKIIILATLMSCKKCDRDRCFRSYRSQTKTALDYVDASLNRFSMFSLKFYQDVIDLYSKYLFIRLKIFNAHIYTGM